MARPNWPRSKDNRSGTVMVPLRMRTSFATLISPFQRASASSSRPDASKRRHCVSLGLVLGVHELQVRRQHVQAANELDGLFVLRAAGILDAIEDARLPR